MGWSHDEKLVCVLENGAVHLYTVHGELSSQFTMGTEAHDFGVVDGCVYSTGVVVLTARNRLYTASFEEPRPRALADPHLDEPPTCMCVHEPQHSLSGTVEVFLGTESGTIYVVDGESCSDQGLTNGPFARIAVSADGAYVAAFAAAGAVWVSLSDFSRVVSQFSTNIKVPPHQLVWVGSDSVIMYWDELLLMVGPTGEWIKYPYEESLVLAPECDGCRVISTSRCEFIQMVPNSTLSIFQIGSTAPAAMLYDAMDAFEKRSAKADENIRAIKGELVLAVNDCIEAASHEFAFATQRSLLRAASFGKSFCDMYPADAFVDMCKDLRVLNAVRHYEIGIAITIDQYRFQTPSVLIDRLVNLHHHLLAFRICTYLGLKPDRVLIHWACAKVRLPPASGVTDAAIADQIVEKLSSCPGISFAEIAATAYQAGRAALATALLDYEPRPSKQVPLLISMKQDNAALTKAIASGDTDLTYFTLLHLKKTLPRAQFFDLVHEKPVAFDLLVTYCKSQDQEMLKTLYYHLDQRERAADVYVAEAYAKPNLRGRLDALKIAQELYRSVPFSFQATADEIKLLQLQAEFEAEFGGARAPGSEGGFLFLDKSVSETLFQLYVMGRDKAADKVISAFKVQEKRYFMLRARALVQNNAWDTLEKFAISKKSPIGYQPFVELCIEANAPAEAAKYIGMLPVPERPQWYISIGYLRQAADCAVKAKDNDLIQYIRSKMDPREQEYLNNLLKQT
jgi:hypothetical protein